MKLDLGREQLLDSPMLFECMGICVVSMANESELGGCPVSVYIVENLAGFFFLNSTRVHVLGWSLLLNFVVVFFLILWSVCGSGIM